MSEAGQYCLVRFRCTDNRSADLPPLPNLPTESSPYRYCLVKGNEGRKTCYLRLLLEGRIAASVVIQDALESPLPTVIESVREYFTNLLEQRRRNENNDNDFSTPSPTDKPRVKDSREDGGKRGRRRINALQEKAAYDRENQPTRMACFVAIVGLTNPNKENEARRIAGIPKTKSEPDKPRKKRGYYSLPVDDEPLQPNLF